MDWTQVMIVVLTLLGGFVTWSLNERSKRAQEDYVRREARYSNLVASLRGFTVDGQSREQKEAFLAELNLCWLYCSDEVIRMAYGFLDTVRVGQQLAAGTKERALGEFMIAVRRDLLARTMVKKTDLRPEDFRLLRSTGGEAAQPGVTADAPPARR